MKDRMIVQNALINIFKTDISKDNIKIIIKTIHKEIKKLIGNEKALNFYIALHIKDDIYTIPYFTDEYNNDPLDKSISLKKGLSEYIKEIKKSVLINRKKQKEFQNNGTISLTGSNFYECIGCPLLYKKKFFGVLVVRTYNENIHYTKNDLKLIEYVSKNISFTIARLKTIENIAKYKSILEDEVKKKTKELLITNKKLSKEITKVKRNETIQKVIFNISDLKNRTLTTRELIKRIHKELSSLIDTENFYVAIKKGNIKGDFLFPFYKDINPEESMTGNNVLKIPFSFTDYVFSSQKPLMADKEELNRIARTTNYKMVGLKPEIWVGIPLKTKNNKILGVVTVQDYSDKKSYSKTDMKLLSLISTTIADALEFRQLEEDKKKLETKLNGAQKMETIGIFAAGMSHEFNNLLSIIIGNAHIGMMSSTPGELYYNKFKKIINSGETASDLIEKLMVFTSFRKNLNHLPYNLKDVMREIISDIKKEKNSEANIDHNFDTDLWSLNVGREDLKIILSNILSNAIDALKKDNVISISITKFSGDTDDVNLKSRQYLKISVKDKGIGINKKSINKLFDPFYTTKNPGKGLGLGLSIVYTIIKEYEGEIKIFSELAKGTTVDVYLPAKKTGEK